MAGLLEGKTAIVTGSSRGIGSAIAKMYAAEGANVVIHGTNAERAEKVCREIQTAGGRAATCLGDVAEDAFAPRLIEFAVREYGGVDIFVSNAGMSGFEPFLTMSHDMWRRFLDVHLSGAFYGGQAAARQMVAQAKSGGKPGCIVNLSSVNAVFALPDHAAYSISKGGIAQLTKAMALSLAKYNIRVNAIGPGSINTAMLQQVMADEGVKRRILSRTPLGRLGEVEEIAAVALFLASEAASYITGQTIYADGGRLPLNYTVPVEGE